jgi:hypothetical protein
MPADPDDLESVDREIRLNRLRDEVESHVESGDDRQWPDESADKGLEYLEAWEFDGFGIKPATLLEKMGISLVPADELTGDTLPGKLGEVIQGLAGIGAYLGRTNHLTDEELYRELWSRMLFEETLLIPQDASFAYHWDPLGGCSDEDIRLHLAYHADDEERAQWLADFPGDELPLKRAPKSQRDATLPRRPMPPAREDDHGDGFLSDHGEDSPEG